MSAWDKKIHLGFRGWTWAASSAALVLLAWVVFLGSRLRSEPSRCASSFLPMGARCCAPGQGLSAGQCVGLPNACPQPFALIGGSTPGCTLPPTRIEIQTGSVTLGPTDWDSVDVIERHIVSVRSFLMDESEVTHHEHEICVSAGKCQATLTDKEPGLPITGLSVKAAQTFCAFHDGRLPTPAEWIFAASGREARRFPWGPHGLACRRASFGLVSGPCSTKGVLPDLAGMRPDGATPEGILDLAGNVAEWALNQEGKASIHGGSFRSKTASEVKVWSSRLPLAGDDVGFRCVYPLDP